MKRAKTISGGGEATIAVQNKRRYEQPLLKRYGNVKALTASGGPSLVEKTGGPAGACAPITTKKSCPSDRRIKENMVLVGTHPLGIGLYLFDYKSAYQQTCGRGRQFGVMADEVERVLPEAVCLHPDGYKMVDHAMLGITRTFQ
jgi:hypothetical protein